MRTIFHNIGSIQTMNEKNSLLEGKNIIVKNNVIEDIVDSTEEFESSDVTFIDVGNVQLYPDLSMHTIILFGLVTDSMNIV